MSKYQYMALVSDIADEISQRTNELLDNIFRQLAAVPREQLHVEALRIVEGTRTANNGQRC